MARNSERRKLFYERYYDFWFVESKKELNAPPLIDRLAAIFLAAVYLGDIICFRL
jgi:hypothetical protein